MRVRLITGALVLGSIGLGFVPIAQAGTETSTLVPDAEGWYQPNPSCQTPAGCVTTGALPVAPPAEPPTSPFPARTMHIGFAGGQETARSYLSFPLFELTGEITDAKLTVPVDVAQGSGTVAPETAKIQVCPTTGTIANVDGSVADPPFLDCSSTAAVTYVATPTPHLEADLGPIRAALGSVTGLALLPDASKATQTDAWRVVFSAHDRADAAKTAPASLELSLETPDTGSTDTPDATEPTTPDFGAVAPPVGTGFAPSTPDLTPSAPVAEPTAPVVSPPTGTPVTSSPELVTVGYQYPAVWLLPLVFLILVPAAGRALTKDLTPQA